MTTIIEYELKRSKRKSINISFTKDGAVIVTAPFKTSQTTIDRVIQANSEWIEINLEKILEAARIRSNFSIDYSSEVSYLGKKYSIIAREGGKIGFDDTTFYMPKDLNQLEIKMNIINIYKMLAKRDLINKTMKFSELMNVKPTTVKVNSAKNNWGSCSNENTINFSWRLIMGEESVIDYVVVHELAHIKEHNHSPKFWLEVEAVLPDYKDRQKKLKELQAKQFLENWDF